MSDQPPGSTGNIVAIDEALERWHNEADEDDRQFGLFAPPQTEAGKAKALVYKRGPGRPPAASEVDNNFPEGVTKLDW
jgi:hypothetical protein